MRSYGQIWQKLVCEENLLAAWHNVRRRRGRSQPVVEFGRDLMVNLESIRHDLVTGSYRHGDYAQFGILDPKPRTISCAQVRDRVVHHAFCNLVAPLLERSMSPRSFACRKGYGSHRALALVRDLAHSRADGGGRAGRATLPAKIHEACHAVDGGGRAGRATLPVSDTVGAEGRRRTRYFLKLDIRHYFDSIDHATLLGLLDRRFRERTVRALAHEIIEHPFPGQVAGKGLPIGNLTSQWFAKNNYGFRLLITGRKGAQQRSHSGKGRFVLACVSRSDGRDTEHVGAIPPVGRFATAQRGRARFTVGARVPRARVADTVGARVPRARVADTVGARVPRARVHDAVGARVPRARMGI